MEWPAPSPRHQPVSGAKIRSRDMDTWYQVSRRDGDELPEPLGLVPDAGRPSCARRSAEMLPNCRDMLLPLLLQRQQVGSPRV